MRRIAWLAVLLLLTGCGAPTGHVAPTRAARPAPTASATRGAAGTTTTATAPAATASAAAEPAVTASAAAEPAAPLPATAADLAPQHASATATASAPPSQPATTTAPAPQHASATATASAPPSQPATPTATATGATSAVRLTPAAWGPAGTGSKPDCATPLTAALVAYGAAGGPVTPGTGGTLTVYVHNNSNLCGAAGAPLSLGATGWRLDLTPLGASAAVAGIDLPAPPARLAPGAEVSLPVRVGAGLAPGWYEASVLVPGAATPPAASLPTLQSIERFLVTAGPSPAGRVTADAYPAPTVGGLSMPLVSVAWSDRDLAVVTVHAPLVCGPGTDRYASFTSVTATAAGHGFTTDLPDVGGGQDPAIAQASWDVPFPGEATSLTLAARVQVFACGSGALVGSNGVAWKVDLPG